jgi:hypothetical protein
VAALLRDLSDADMARLLEIVEDAPSPAREAQVQELLQAAVAAAAGHNAAGALDQLRQLAALDPSRAETLASEPAMASLRPVLEQLLSQLTGAARLHAEGRLGEASRLLETAAAKDLAAREIRPEAFLLVASRLMDVGGLANYVRSAAVSGVLIDACRWAPVPVWEPEPGRQAARELRPLLRFLFLAWLALGMVGASVCWWLQYDRLQVVLEVWGAGLLALVSLSAWGRARPT